MAQTNVQVFSGNVGIGVTAPDEALHVNGNIRIGGAAGVDDNSEKYIKTGTQLTIHGNDTDLDDSFVGTTVQAGVSNVASITLLGGKTNTLYQHIALSTKNTERMRIDRNGNVGIGMNAPVAKLHIKTGTTLSSSIQSLRSNAAIRISAAGDNNDCMTFGLFDVVNGTGNNPTGYIQNSWDSESDIGRPLVLNPTGGNVGIGLTNPAAFLDVNGSVRGAYNADTTSYFGRSAIGYTGHSDHASLSHIDQNSGGGYALLQSSNGTTYLNCASSQNIAFRVANADKMRMDGNGRLGIGTSTVRVPLHVHGGVNPEISSGQRYYGAFYNRGGGNSWIYDTSYWGESTSIYGTHSIVCGGYLASLQGTIGASDERIKKEIVDVEDGSALETLRLLKPKKYKYVDEVQRGTEPVWGFIAQEVRETLPYATQLRTDCLPNIYELANVSASNVITFTNFDTSNLESNAMVLKVYDVNDAEHLVNIAEVIDGHSIRVNEDLSKWTGSVDESGNVITQTETTTLTLEEYEALALDDNTNYVLGESNTYTKTTTTNIGNNLFVYGQEVSDFLFLKKEAIFTVATSALQEVDRQLQAERVKVATLETQVASVLTRLDALESA
jgi:hypothetical protein